MKLVEVIIDGKAVRFPQNNSGWISDSEQSLPEGWNWEKLKSLPRLRNGCDGVPVVQLGNREVKLGWQGFTDEEKKMYNEYKSGHSSGGTRKVSGNSEKWNQIARIVLSDEEMMKKLGTENVEFLKTCVLEDPKILTAIKAFMALGFTEEQARAAINNPVAANK